MPTYRVETDKGTYDIEADREPTQADVMAHLQGLGGDSASKVAPKDVKALQTTWANSGPEMRAKMLLAHFPGYAKDGVDGTMKVVRDMGLEAGGAVAGQAIGSMVGPVASRVLGGLGGGGGNLLAQYMDGGPISYGRVGGAAVAGAMGPGPSLENAATGKLIAQAGRSGVGNLAAKTTQTVIDEGRLPTGREALEAAGAGAMSVPVAKAMDKGLNSPTLEAAVRRAKDATRRSTIELAKEIGYVLTPAKINDNAVNNALNSVGGKAATLQAVQRANQPITDSLAKKELGLMDETSLSIPLLGALKKVHGKAYDDVARVSPTAAANLELYKQAEADAAGLFKTYREQFPKKPDILDAAKQTKAEADRLFADIEAEAVKAGKPDLAKNLKESRIALAKVGLVERAMNKSDGSVSAKIIGEAWDAGEPVTGNLQKIAQVQQGFSQMLRDGADVPAPGVSQLTAYLGAAAGGWGYNTFGPAGVALAGAPFAAQEGARKLMMSKMYQNSPMVQPNYGMTRPDVPAMLARYATMDAGR